MLRIKIETLIDIRAMKKIKFRRKRGCDVTREGCGEENASSILRNVVLWENKSRRHLINKVKHVLFYFDGYLFL